MMSEHGTKANLSRLSSALRYVLAGVPFVVIFWKVDFREMLTTLQGASWWTVPLIIVSCGMVTFIQAARWWWLIRPFDTRVSLARVFVYQLVGGFYSLIVPSGVSLDIARGAVALRKIGYSTAWASVWVGRLSGFLGWAVLALAGAAMAGTDAVGLRTWVLVVVGGLVVLGTGIFLSFSKTATAPVRRKAESLAPSRVMRTIMSIREGVFRYRERVSVLVVALVLTIVFQLVLIVGSALVVYGICSRFPFWEFMAFFPLIELAVTAFPLTPNGLGIRELLVALMFNALAFTPGQTRVYIVLCFIPVVLRLVGAVPALMGGGTVRACTDSPQKQYGVTPPTS